MNVHFTKKAYKVKIVMKGEAGGGGGKKNQKFDHGVYGWPPAQFFSGKKGRALELIAWN